MSDHVRQLQDFTLYDDLVDAVEASSNNLAAVSMRRRVDANEHSPTGSFIRKLTG